MMVRCKNGHYYDNAKTVNVHIAAEQTCYQQLMVIVAMKEQLQ